MKPTQAQTPAQKKRSISQRMDLASFDDNNFSPYAYIRPSACHM